MKRINYFLIILIVKSAVLHSQGVYFKTSVDYNIAASSQQMPQYFSYKINYGMGPGSYNINLNVNDFSVAAGVDFQGAVGYSVNDFLSFELKFSTFSNSEQEFDAYPASEYVLNGKTVWDLHHYDLLPTILFGKTFNRSKINVFLYSGLGISQLNIQASVNDNFCEYKFGTSDVFSWGYGLEYSYSISNGFSLFTSIGINNTNYKPEKARLISSSSSMEYLTTSQKEIKYVDEITNLNLSYYGGTGDPQKPETRLSETLRLNSIYFGFGLKYAFKK